MKLTSETNNKKPHNPHLDHYVVHSLGRDFADTFISEDTLRKLDDAKRQLAETAGVREEHIQLDIQMLVLAKI